MTATFLVAVSFDDPEEVQYLSEDIIDALENAGISVDSVKPWQRDTLPQIPPILP